MDVNIATDVKGYGAPVVANVEREEAAKSVIPPVQPSTASDSVKLDQKALQKKGTDTQEQQKTDSPVDSEKMEKVVEEVQKRMDAIGSKLQFGLQKREGLSEMVVQITDRESGELIKQFPAEEVLQIKEKLNDLIGLLFDKQA